MVAWIFFLFLFPLNFGRLVSGYVLILRWACDELFPPAAFLLNNALVVENVLEAVGCTAAVIGPVVVVLLLTRVSLQSRLMAGRVAVCEIGTLKTFASDASAGERGRILNIVGGLAGLVIEDKIE